MASDKAYPDARFADDIAGVGELDVETLQKLLAGKHVTASAMRETGPDVDALLRSRRAPMAP
jgi:hypothetical protein